MNRTRALILLCIGWLILMFAAGCNRLQPGYYLTPENYPTSPPTSTLPATPVTPSATPVSTVQEVIFPTMTLTPFGATQGPTATATSSPTPTLPPCNDTQGEVVEDVFFSQQAGHEIHYRVYLPPCYSVTGRRYPYIIMVHGWGPEMDDSQWDRLGMPEAADQGYVTGALPPMIIIMPNGNEALFMDDTGPFPDMVVEELIPTIDQRLCTWSDAAHRGIGGLSRGGYWAFWIAFSHPELFNRVGGHSPYLYQPEFSSEKNVFNIVDTAPGLDNLAIYLDHGGENREVIEVQPGVESLVERLEERGLSPLYVANTTGDHDENYWSSHVSEYLAFYAGDWPRDATQYPGCAEPNP